jgi:hypothetical protein
MIDLRLTKTQRLRAACAIALLYLLCVMTPTVALALPGTAIPDCLVTDGTAMVHVHNHDFGEHQHHAMHTDHAGGHVHDVALNVTDGTSGPTPAHSNHHSNGGSCCELMCLTALPAVLTDVRAPDQPVSRCINEVSRVMAGSAPPRLYRPPIS